VVINVARLHCSLSRKIRKDIPLLDICNVAAHYIRKADITVLVVAAFLLESSMLYLQFISSCKARNEVHNIRK
jgi:hypothetical protein